ncbi:MAG: D-aminoacyl-tRNA deacylase [Acidimicrobiia bacterium]|nr:D-tyrosyl-tRNA(Tyr) deacylase [Acidimicrobiia bacterium]
MKAVVQRVARASVEVDGEIVGAIDAGLLVLVGVARSDSEADAQAIAAKIAGLRVFADDAGHMNLSVKDVGGSVLVVSQFTLYGDAVKGRRPSFTAAAAGEEAEPLVEAVAIRVEQDGVVVARGRFGARMAVRSVNDGPVTILLETRSGRLV